MLKVSKDMMVDAACQSDPSIALQTRDSTTCQPDPMACTQDSGSKSEIGANIHDAVRQPDPGAAVRDPASRVLDAMEATGDAEGQPDVWHIHSAITVDSVRNADESISRVDLDVVDVGRHLRSVSGTRQDVGPGIVHQDIGVGIEHDDVAGDGAAGADHDTVCDALDQGDALMEPASHQVESRRGVNGEGVEQGSGEGEDEDEDEDDNHDVDAAAVPDHGDDEAGADGDGDGDQDEYVSNGDAVGAEARSPVHSAVSDRDLDEEVGEGDAARAVAQPCAHSPIGSIAYASRDRRGTQERIEQVFDAKEGARGALERSQLRRRQARVQNEIEGMQQSRREAQQQGQQGQRHATGDGTRQPFLYNSGSRSKGSSAATRARMPARRAEEDDVRPGWHLGALLSCVVASPVVWTLLAGGGAAGGAKNLVLVLSSLSLLDCAAVSVSLAAGYAVGYSMVVSRAGWKLFGLALGLLVCTHLALNAAWDCAMLDLGMIERAGGAKAVAAGCLTVVSCLTGGYFVGYTATVWAGR
jgi:hypothetical protein